MRWRRASLPTPWRRASLPTPCRRLADASGRASGFAQGRMRGRKHRKVQTRAVIHRCTRNKQTHTVTEQSHTDDDTQTQRRADGGRALQAMRELAGPRPTPENMIRTGTQWAGRNLITTHSDTHTHTYRHTHTRFCSFWLSVQLPSLAPCPPHCACRWTSATMRVTSPAS